MYETQTLNQRSPIVKRALMIRAKMHLLHPVEEVPSTTHGDLADILEQQMLSPTHWYQPDKTNIMASNQQNWSKVELAPGRGSAYACSGRTE